MNNLSNLIKFLISAIFMAALNPPNLPTNLTGTYNGQPANGWSGNQYCTPQGIWVGPTSDGAALMPIACMYTLLSNTPSPGVVHGPFTTLATLQASINAGACGDVHTVTAGTDLGIGTINLPAKGCDNAHWITIRTTGTTNVNFPAEGTRMTPCWAGKASMPGRPAYPCASPQNLMFKISAPLSGNAVADNGDHYRIIGSEITRNQSPGIVYALVTLPGSSAPFPNNLILDRVWGDGVEGTFPQTTLTSTETKRFLDLGQSNHVALIDSYISNMYCDGSISACDSQVMAGGFGSTANSDWGVYKIVNNHSEAAGESILFGGGNGPALTPTGCTIMVNCNLDVVTDLEVRSNYFFKPLSWNGNTTTVNTAGWPIVKNGFEMKMGARALFEGNVIENCWFSSQGCGAFNVAPVDQQSGGTTPVATCPTCGVQDFTYRFNYSYNTAYGIAVYSFTPTTCPTCQSQGMNRVSIHDNIIGDNMNMGILTNRNSGDAIELLADNDPTNRGLNKTQNLVISHNTFVKSIRSLTLFGGPTSNSQFVNLVMRDNLWPYGNFGFVSVGNAGGCDTVSGGSFYVALNNCVSTWAVDHNAEFSWNGGTPLGRNWPTDGKGANNFFTIGTAAVGFTNYGTGDSNFNLSNYALLPSSPYHNAASDGRDIGADTAKVATAIAGVRE